MGATSRTKGKAGEPDQIDDAAPCADRQARALQRQRQRRATRPRIDFYPSDEAVRVIDALRHPSVGGDASSIINRALIEWGASGILRCPKRRVTQAARQDLAPAVAEPTR